MVNFHVRDRDVERGEVREPLKDESKERNCFTGFDFERESETIGDGEELFGDHGERFESVVVVVEEFEDALPYFLWQM
jgi:hypothetical protein